MNKLKQKRINSGLKAKKIAELLGISRVQFYNLENRKYKIDSKKAKVLSELYKCSEEEILNDFCIKGD